MPRLNQLFREIATFVSCAMLTSAALAAPRNLTPSADDVLNLGLRGVYFVPNGGQWPDAEVHFGLRSRGLDVAFRESALTMHMVRQTSSESRGREDALLPSLDALLPDGGDLRRDRPEYEHLTLTVSFPGSNHVLPEGDQPLTTKFNYFVGGEGRGVASDVPSFGAVVYHNLYDGVDLHVMGSDDGVLKYEFHVEPGANYGQIRIAYDGIESLCIDDSGDLCIGTAFGILTDRAPLVWQERDSERTDITARFEVCDGWTYRIVIGGAVDTSRKLVIDPDVEWMYFVGGLCSDQCYGIAKDASGNLLVTGETCSRDFTMRTNAYHGGPGDAFVTKITPAGETLWTTYIGGSQRDWGWGIAVDSTGASVIVGDTQSPDLEGSGNAYHGGSNDGFAAKVDAQGQLAWAMYLGGLSGDYARAVAVSSEDHAVVVGITTSPDFEGRLNTPYGSSDAYVLDIDTEGQLLWMVYVGGTNTDESYGVSIDSDDNVVFVGYTGSTDFVGQTNSNHGRLDAFVTKVGAMGEVLWTTYLGGSGDEYTKSVAVNRTGHAMIVGRTASNDFEGRLNAYHDAYDAFAVGVDPTGRLEGMVYFGGSQDDYGNGITSDANGDWVMAGSTFSTDFDGRQNEFSGEFDGFALQFNGVGELAWMLYLGSFRTDEGWGLTVGDAGNLFVVGTTGSSEFVGKQNSFFGGLYDGYLVNIRVASTPTLTVTATCPTGGPIQVSWSGATPDGQIGLIFARDEGTFSIPNGRPCAGTILGLGTNQIQIAFQGSAGSDGSRTLNSNAGSGVCGGYLQLLDIPTCGTSNVVRIE